ncbi:hypothetical protein ACHAWF_016746 [Thalassiosira exigua]
MSGRRRRRRHHHHADTDSRETGRPTNASDDEDGDDRTPSPSPHCVPPVFEATLLRANTPEHRKRLVAWSRDYYLRRTSPSATPRSTPDRGEGGGAGARVRSGGAVGEGDGGGGDIAPSSPDRDAIPSIFRYLVAREERRKAGPPDPGGRSVLCAPSAPPGVFFRINGDDEAEAVRATPPEASGGDGEGEEGEATKGGSVEVVGRLPLQVRAGAMRAACSLDGRLLLVGCSDGSLLCTDVLYDGGGASVRFSPRWTMQTIDGGGQAARFPSLEFLDGDRRHHFLAVAEAPSGATNAILMDAASSSGAPPSTNLWPSCDDAGGASCASARPGETELAIAFGAPAGALGIISLRGSDSTVRWVEHPLSDPGDDDGPWKISHLNWFDPHSLAVGLARAIADPERREDDDPDDPDDPDEHQAGLLVGESVGDGAGSWTWSELGDPCPFFSMPRGGRHAFHTAALPASSSSRASGSSPLLLAACNVASDVAVVGRRGEGAGSAEWEVLELAEGDGAACPTDEDDEFSYPTGLAAVLAAGPGSRRPLPVLASTDGSATARCPRHRGIGDYFALSAAEEEEGGRDAGVPLPKDESSSAPKAGNAGGFSFGGGGGDAGSSFGAAFGVTATTFGVVGETSPAKLSAGGGGFGSSAATPTFGSAFGLTAPAPTFGSASGAPAAAPTFGSAFGSTPGASASLGAGGFGALASATAAGGGGFGAATTETAKKKEHVFGTEASFSSSTGFQALAVKAPPSEEAWGARKEGGGDDEEEAKSEEANSDAVRSEGAKDEDATAALQSPKRTESRPPEPSEVAEQSDGLQALLQTAPGKKAARAFNSLLADAEGSDVFLLSSHFESLIEEIGEGFHGDEFDRQLALVDTDGTGEITKCAFVRWYCNLVEQGGDDESSQGSEIAEERAKAEGAFSAFVGEGSTSTPASSFGELLESMGTTYCEEEHRRTIKKIATKDESSGKSIITRKAFLDWYVDWLFGDGESDEESTADSDEEEESDRHHPKEGEGVGNSEGWGSMFKTSEEGSWKCTVCMVTNKPSVTACAACDAPRPGEEGKTPGTSIAKSAAPGSIGAGGFSFGIAPAPAGSTTDSAAADSSSGIGSGGFTFGGFGGKMSEQKAEEPKAESTGPGGFSFGSTGSTAPSTTGIGSGGFSFGGTAPKPSGEKPDEPLVSEEGDDLKVLLETPSGKKAMQVFKTILAASEGSDPTLPSSKFESLVEEIGEGFHGDELDKQLALVDPDGSGQLTSVAFVRWYCNLVDQEDESSQESDIAEEKAKAEDAFDKFGEGSKKIKASDFGDLLGSMGTTYCEEEHRRTIKKISSVDESSREKIITRKVFVDWYVAWLFGDGESDEESFVESNAEEESSQPEVAKEGGGKSEGWGSMFKTSEEGSWKCTVCMVTNKKSDATCVACETPKPDMEGRSSEGSAAKPATAGSIGAGGFSFGGAPSASKAEANIGAGGFTFAGFGTKLAVTDAEREVTRAAVSGGFSFGASSTVAPASSGIGAGGFSFCDVPKPDESKADVATAPKGKADDTGQGPKSESGSKDSSAKKGEGSVSNSAAFPPISATAPKPFGALSKKEEGKAAVKAPSSSAAFPPMSKAAPSPFGAVSKKEENKVPEKAPRSRAAFPPMSKASPSPFGAFSKKDEGKSAEKTSVPSFGGAAFPPMSKAAPSPFGAFSKKEDGKASEKAPSSSAAFPPMSKAAPSPFGASSKKDGGKAVEKVTAPSFGGAAFPPMSKAAPSPFGGISKKDEGKAAEKTAAPSFGGAAFPPMSKAAPSPFGGLSNKDGSKGAEKALSSSAAFPPMSTAAPSPFGAFSKKDEGKAAEKTAAPSFGGAAFPSMSKTAPSPFGGLSKKDDGKAAEKVTAPSFGGTAFPPMSKAAPSPFGGISKKEESQAAEKGVAPTSSAAFPPMSTSAPKNPFTSKPSTGALFPPMSATAPKPFGVTSKKEMSKADEASVAAASPSLFGTFQKTDEKKAPEKVPRSTAFPPMAGAAPKKPLLTKPPTSSSSSDSVPKLFDPSKKELDKACGNRVGPSSNTFPSVPAAAPKPFASASDASRSDQSAASIPPKQPFPVSSRHEAELWGQVKLFSQKISTAKELRGEAASCVPLDMGNDIENIFNTYQEKIAHAGLLEGQNAAAIEKRLLHLLSVQDDLDRQKEESKLAIEEQTGGHMTSINVARSEPLDVESEKMRRAIVAKSHKVQSLISTAENRVALNKEIFSCSKDNQRGIVRPSDYYNQWSRTPPKAGRQQTAKSATGALFKALTSGYDEVRDFESHVTYLSEKSTRLSNSHGRKEEGQGASQSAVKKTKNKTRIGSLTRTNISPLPTSHLRSPLRSRRNQSQDSVSIIERQRLLRQMAKPLPGETAGCPTKTFHLRGPMISRDSSASQAKIPDWRSRGKNELFSNSRASNQTNLQTKPFAASPALAKTLFSSPVADTRCRDWNTNPESAPLQVNLPQKLKVVNRADAVKTALSKFGTTPEQLAEGRDIISRDAVESKLPLKSSSDKRTIPIKPNLSSATASSNATFATLSKSEPPINFPKPPKPASQPLDQEVGLRGPSLTPVPGPSKTVNDIDYKAVLTKFFQDNSPSKVKEVDSLLQKYKGKESDMFVGLAKKFNTQNALNEVFDSRVKGVDRNDFIALTQLFFEVFSPSRAGSAEKYVAQHKGKEAELFAKLSYKFYAINPLEAKKETAVPIQTKPPPSNLFSPSSDKPRESAPAPAPSPFTTASAPAPSSFVPSSSSAQSPFTAANASAPSPSPFANTAAPESVASGDEKADYHKLLTEFYQKHNAQKIAEVTNTLEKYKGREPELFAKLAKKYKTSNPLDDKPPTSTASSSSTATSFGFGGMTFGGEGDKKPPFGSTTAASSGASVSTTSSATTAPTSNTTAFGVQSKTPFGTTSPAPAENKSPFGAASAAPAPGKSPFSSSSSNAFGTSAPLGSSPSPFGGTSGGSAFGAGAPAASPFGSASAAPAPAFGSASAAPAPAFGSAAPAPAFGSAAPAPAFGSAAPAPAPAFGAPAAPASAFGAAPPATSFGQPAAAPAGSKFGGRNPRDILVSFYQQHNPSKMNDIDKVLTKYAGKEEQLFVNLAKKYNLDPSMFGVTAPPPTAAPSTGAATFGAPPSLGMGSSPGFGASPGFGGSTSTFGAGGGFAGAPQGGGFGSLAGSAPASGAFGGFGGAAASSFGSPPNPFGAARR